MRELNALFSVCAAAMLASSVAEAAKAVAAEAEAVAAVAVAAVAVTGVGKKTPEVFLPAEVRGQILVFYLIIVVSFCVGGGCFVLSYVFVLSCFVSFFFFLRFVSFRFVFSVFSCFVLCCLVWFCAVLFCFLFFVAFSHYHFVAGRWRIDVLTRPFVL